MSETEEPKPKRKRKSLIDPGEGPLKDPRVARYGPRRRPKLNKKTKYRKEFEQRLIDSAMTGKAMCLKNAAYLCHITIRTVSEWFRRYPEFRAAYDRARAINDDVVEQGLFERAKGYEHSDTHIAVYRGEVIQTKILKQYPPDTEAAKFWLKNRRPDAWKEKSEVEQSGTVEHRVVLFGDDTDDGSGKSGS